jgi:hypothetical protein
MIINPILYWQQEANMYKLKPESKRKFLKETWLYVKEALIGRLTAIFTSVFAAIDAFIHLGAGCYKGIRLLLKAHTIQQKTEVFEHFKRAAFFTGMTIVGSIAGLIDLDLLKHFQYYPTDRPPPTPVVRARGGRRATVPGTIDTDKLD